MHIQVCFVIFIYEKPGISELMQEHNWFYVQLWISSLFNIISRCSGQIWLFSLLFNIYVVLHIHLLLLPLYSVNII